MSDYRSQMIRLASTMPKGSKQRKALLNVLAASPSADQHAKAILKLKDGVNSADAEDFDLEEAKKMAQAMASNSESQIRELTKRLWGSDLGGKLLGYYRKHFK